MADRQDEFRRSFLLQGARLAGLAGLSLAFPGAVQSRSAAYPFALGVASGSPRADSVVLWTRLSADPLSAEAFAPGPVQVRWELAADENFRQVLRSGEATALGGLAHSIHVEPAGLQPDRWYWYRFMLDDAVSPVGRTRTAPATDALPGVLKLAFASCQHWEFGHYAAHRHIATSHPDLILFLGDYIYEWGPFDAAHPDKPRGRRDPGSRESLDLDSYRRRYAQYKSDADLQAAHAAAPWMVTWDDHEVANDYANDRDERLDGNFLVRRAAAYQAFYEHMPIRLPQLPAGPNAYAHFRLYERYDWGRLARFNMLDDRQYRAWQACAPSGRGGSTSVGAACTERLDPARSMLGREQESWLAHGMSSSPARWNILAQQTLMAQNSQVAIRQPEDGRFWTDAWDGYPAARARLLDDIARLQPSNPLVLGGDVHSFYAAELRRDFLAPVSAANPVLATELVGTSITSSSREQSRTDAHVANNPHIKFGRSDRRGHVLMTITPQRTEARFIALDDVHRADSGAFDLASWIIEDGRPGLQKA